MGSLEKDERSEIGQAARIQADSMKFLSGQGSSITHRLHDIGLKDQSTTWYRN
jgi:hypothetical protein